MLATVRVGVNSGPIYVHNGLLVWVKFPFYPGLLFDKHDGSLFCTKVESDFPISCLKGKQNMHSFRVIVCS